MRGRKPKPTHLRIIQGNAGRRPLNKREPQPPAAPEDLEPPAHLKGEAAAEWARKLPVLRAMEVLTAADLSMLAAWCSCYSDYVAAERGLRRDGLLVKDRDGNVRRSPWYFVKAKAIEQLARIAAEFGFTPSSRTRLGFDLADDERRDPFDEFLNRASRD